MSLYSKITKIDPSKFHEITIEILSKYSFGGGATDYLTTKYWDEYIKIYNMLCDKYSKIYESENPPFSPNPNNKSLI